MNTIYRCEALCRSAGSVVTLDQAIVVRGGRVVDVGGYSTISHRYGVAQAVELPGLTLPGFVDAHSHLRSRAAVQQSHMPDRKLEAWVYSLPELTPLPAGEDALAASAVLLRAGVTSVQVMLHSWADAAGRLQELDQVVRAVHRVGLRALLILGLTDQAEFVPESVTGHRRSGEPQRGLAPRQWREFVSAAEALVEPYAPLITLGVGPVAPQWCSDEALNAIAQSRGSKRVHTHVLESALQLDWEGKPGDQVQRLARASLLGPFTSLAHAVFANREQLEAVSVSGASLVHCHASNIALSTGQAAVSQWGRMGIPTAMGLDSQIPGSVNYLNELRVCAGAHFDFGAAFAAATLGGASALGEPVGRIAAGTWADFVSIDCDVSRASAGIEGVLTGADPAMLYSVVVGGQHRLPFTGRLDREISRTEDHLVGLVEEDAVARNARLRALTPELHALGFTRGDGR